MNRRSQLLLAITLALPTISLGCDAPDEFSELPGDRLDEELGESLDDPVDAPPDPQESTPWPETEPLDLPIAEESLDDSVDLEPDDTLEWEGEPDGIDEVDFDADPEIRDVVASQTDAALSTKVKTFHISNPGGNSKKLRITSSIPSGSGKVHSMGIFDYSPYFVEKFEVPCNGGGGYNTSWCRIYDTLAGGCHNYGTVTVPVEYSGSVTPKLYYWFYDC